MATSCSYAHTVKRAKPNRDLDTHTLTHTGSENALCVCAARGFGPYKKNDKKKTFLCNTSSTFLPSKTIEYKRHTPGHSAQEDDVTTHRWWHAAYLSVRLATDRFGNVSLLHTEFPLRARREESRGAEEQRKVKSSEKELTPLPWKLFHQAWLRYVGLSSEKGGRHKLKWEEKKRGKKHSHFSICWKIPWLRWRQDPGCFLDGVVSMRPISSNYGNFEAEKKCLFFQLLFWI